MKQISKAHKHKLDRYEMLQDEISNSSLKCNLNCVELGSRGLWSPMTILNIWICGCKTLQFLHQGGEQEVPPVQLYHMECTK